MSAYDRELIPTPTQQIERQYPEWAMSTPRLRVQGAKVIAISSRLNKEGLRALLKRLDEEGLEPCYGAALFAHDERKDAAHEEARTAMAIQAMRGVQG